MVADHRFSLTTSREKNEDNQHSRQCQQMPNEHRAPTISCQVPSVGRQTFFAILLLFSHCLSSFSSQLTRYDSLALQDCCFSTQRYGRGPSTICSINFLAAPCHALLGVLLTSHPQRNPHLRGSPLDLSLPSRHRQGPAPATNRLSPKPQAVLSSEATTSVCCPAKRLTRA